MNVHGVSLLEQSFERGHAGGQTGLEFGAVEVRDRDARESQTCLVSCGLFLFDPTVTAILVRLKTENGRDLQ
jgi:hypothetical protein